MKLVLWADVGYFRDMGFSELWTTLAPKSSDNWGSTAVTYNRDTWCFSQFWPLLAMLQRKICLGCVTLERIHHHYPKTPVHVPAESQKCSDKRFFITKPIDLLQWTTLIEYTPVTKYFNRTYWPLGWLNTLIEQPLL